MLEPLGKRIWSYSMNLDHQQHIVPEVRCPAGHRNGSVLGLFTTYFLLIHIAQNPQVRQRWNPCFVDVV